MLIWDIFLQSGFFENKTEYQNLYYLLKVRKIKKAEIEDKNNKLLINYNLES
jgi:ABC-type methionine transport system ATPase subunit